MSVKRVPLPEELLSQLEEAGDKANMGYATAAEAVKDAIRIRIDQLNALLFNQRGKTEKEAATAGAPA